MISQSLEKSILKKIKPTGKDNERIKVVQDQLVRSIKDVCKRMGLEKVEPKLVGSVAKDTHLKQVDLDIFIMFPAVTPRAELEKLSLKIGREVMPNAVELYAEHPYLRGTSDDIMVDIVPCYTIKDPSEKLSAVDRTPFHMEYVQKYLKNELKDDVRLFKQFLKGIHAYGAEIRYQGFSGYLCELLVMEFSGFHNLLSAALKWQVPGTTTIIPKVIENNFDKAALSKFTEPLILIDPVDTTRNVASPVSEDTLVLLQQAAEIYLKSPDERFFFPKTPEPMAVGELERSLKQLQGLVLGLEIITRPVLPDILFSQVRKSLKVSTRLLELNEFSVARTKFYVDELGDKENSQRILLLLLLDLYDLPDKKVHEGPPESHPNSEKFLEKWQSAENVLYGPYKKDGRWYVDIQREYTSAVELLRDRFNSLNCGKQLNDAVQRGNYKIFSGPELAQEQFAAALTEFIQNKMPWQN